MKNHPSNPAYRCGTCGFTTTSMHCPLDCCQPPDSLAAADLEHIQDEVNRLARWLLAHEPRHYWCRYGACTDCQHTTDKEATP